MSFTVVDPDEIRAFLEVDSESWRAAVTQGPQGYEAHAVIEPLDTDGTMDSELAALKRLVSILSSHTSTPDDGILCYWDGWGVELDARAIEGVARRYFVTFAPLSGIANWPGDIDEAGGIAPAFIWPRDRAWVVAKDVDQEVIGLAAPMAVIQALANEPTVRVSVP